ncbi:MAG: hypothetical protein ACPGID_11060, partial [Rubricella sp.]
MIRFRLAPLLVLLAFAALPEAAVAERLEEARAGLARAEAALAAAAEAPPQTRLRAHADAVRAYEGALVSIRAAARRARAARIATQDEFDRQREAHGAVLGALQRIAAAPVPVLLLHPDGADGAARASLTLDALLPDLQRETDRLAAQLALLEAAEIEASETAALLADGLAGQQESLRAIQQVIAGRAEPARLGPPGEVVERLAADAETLRAFAASLVP